MNFVTINFCNYCGIGCTVEVYSDEKKNFKGLFFQDDLMKQAFQAYPEILFMDATYKLLELGLPTYLFLSEDSNGQSEITGVCLLTSKDADSMKWMIEVFKRCNDEWRNTRVVMADKDIQERDVIKQCLPESSVMICLFHTLRSFRREISCEKMGISAGQRTLSLEIVQKLAYASSEAEYDELYSQLKQDAPSEVVQYFDLNWHPIRKEWVLGLKSACGSFLNATNNRLESINGKLKQVINRNSSLEDFISSFFTILTALRTERDHKAAVMFQKVKVVPYDQGSPESEYSKLLTSYASSFVIKQIQLAPKVKGIKSVGDQYVVDTSEGNKVVSLTDCYCVFRKSMLLPCRHMLALRIMLKEPVFDSTICEKRWTSAYYRSTQRLFSTHSSQPSLSVMESAKQKRKLSQHEKYRKALLLTSELASVASGASHIHFHRRIKLLQELIDHWKGGREVGLVDLNEGEYTSSCSDICICESLCSIDNCKLPNSFCCRAIAHNII